MKIMKLQRRGAAAALLVGVLLVSACSADGGDPAATGCEPAPEGTKVTLTYNSWVPGFEKTVDLWNSENPDIQVDYNQIPNGVSGSYQTYLNQIKSGKTDDLGFIDYDVLPTFRSEGGLRNFYDCPGVAEAQAEFIPAIWNQISLGEEDTAYGLGFDFGPMTLFYRSDLFEQAGIEIPTTWEEYYDAAVKIRALGGYIGNFDSNLASFFPSMWMQNDKNWFSQEDGTWTASIDSDENKEVADFIQRLYDEDLVTTYPGLQDEFGKALNSGQIWSQLGGPWMTALLPNFAADTAGNWSAAKGPVWEGSDQVGVWGGGSIAMFSGTKHPYEASQFALWVTTDPDALALNASQGGAFPPIVDVVSKVPELQEGIPFYGDQAVSATVSEYAGDVSDSWVWGPTMLQVNADLIPEFGKAITGDQTVFEALQALQAKTVQTMEDQGISVSQ